MAGIFLAYRVSVLCVEDVLSWPLSDSLEVGQRRALLRPAPSDVQQAPDPDPGAGRSSA
jgi:hypothetical protein